MFPALNFLFDILISSSIFLTSMSQCADISVLLFSCTSCRIGIIGSAFLCNFDGMGATNPACTEILRPQYKKEGWILFCGYLWGKIEIGLLGVDGVLEIANLTLFSFKYIFDLLW